MTLASMLVAIIRNINRAAAYLERQASLWRLVGELGT
jgi:type II secretory pathway component PulJ